MVFIIFMLFVLATLYLICLAVGLFQILDELLDYTISDFIKNMFDTGSKIIKTILHKK